MEQEIEHAERQLEVEALAFRQAKEYMIAILQRLRNNLPNLEPSKMSPRGRTMEDERDKAYMRY
jgi:hypothetical protein